MTVWYNSYTNKFLSDRAHEEYFNNLMKSYDTDYNFEVFLGENYSPTELFHFTNDERNEALERFADWVREKAENDDLYEPYEVRLASDEVEK